MELSIKIEIGLLFVGRCEGSLIAGRAQAREDQFDVGIRAKYGYVMLRLGKVRCLC